jgi:hypothetical protein
LAVIPGGLRAVYRTLELPGKRPLKDAHAALDAAVLAAYGFSAKADLLKQLLDLNHAVRRRTATRRGWSPTTASDRVDPDPTKPRACSKRTGHLSDDSGNPSEAITMPNTDEPGNGFGLQITFSGGMADRASLQLREYSASLAGWEDFFRLASELYLRSQADMSRVPSSQLVQIQIRAEKGGSYVTGLEFVFLIAATEWIKKGSTAAYERLTPLMLNWFRSLVTTHVATKTATTNVEEIAAALTSMAQAAEIDLSAGVADTSPPTALNALSDAEYTGQIDTDQIDDVAVPASRPRQLAEKIDLQLKAATEPLEGSCTKITVTDATGTTLITLGPKDRAVISEPLSLPPPNRTWFQTKVRFVRINKNTGRALFNFEAEEATPHGSHFSKIVDPRVKAPGNPYTTAFNDNVALSVWARQRAAPRGRLNMQWDLTTEQPENQGVFPWGG